MGDLSREPSMEEILSSIRRVIARDEQGAAAAAASPSSNAAPTESAADDVDDVLDLTDLSPEPDTVTEESDDMQAEATGEKAAELVAPESLAASRQSLEALAAVMAGKGQAAAHPPIEAGISVNALVEAAIRPMLKQWLDAHLPDVVERLVAKEITRITGDRL